jgi:hypothetical protein
MGSTADAAGRPPFRPASHVARDHPGRIGANKNAGLRDSAPMILAARKGCRTIGSDLASGLDHLSSGDRVAALWIVISLFATLRKR